MLVRDTIIGRAFKNLTVVEEIERLPGEKGSPKYKCVCICGNIIEAKRLELVKYIRTSCGCIEDCRGQREQYTEKKKTV